MKTLVLAAAALALAAPQAQAQTAHRAHPAPAAPTASPTAAARPTANPAFRQTGILWQRAAGATAWIDSARYTYSRFTATNLPRLELREKAATRGAALAAFRQARYQYNAAGSRLTDSTITYTAGVPNAYPSSVRTFAYNPQGRLTEEILYVRSAGVLRAFYRDTYTYNAQGQNTRILYEYNLSSTGINWLYDSQYLITYNAQGRPVQEDLDVADVSGMAFTPFGRTAFAYNPAGLLLTVTDLGYDATTSAYNNQFRSTYAYNAASLLSTLTVERYVASAWAPYQTYTETYDADNNLTAEVSQLYKNGTFVNDTRNLYTYQRILATTPANARHANLVALPNPAAAGTAAALRYELPTAAPVAARVFDAAGRVVATVPASSAIQAAGPHTLALPALATPGLYLVRLSAGAQSQTVRLAVE